MGGTPPLGYAPNDRTLTVVDEHATLIRHLFTRYLALGSVRLLQEELAGQGITVPARVSISGKPLGGGTFTRGQLYSILKNVIYRGQIAHKDKIYSGLHAAIIDEKTFSATQTMLADHLQGHRSRANAAETSPLAGKVVDADGEPLIATHACKGKVRHRYYVSRALHHGGSDTGLRLPSRELESLVAERVAQLFAQPLELASAASLDVQVHQVEALHARAADVAASMAERRSPMLAAMVREVRASKARCNLQVLSV